MKEYFSSMIAVSALMGVIEALAPSSERLGKYIRAIGLVILLCIAISPLSDLLGDIQGGVLEDLRDEIGSRNDLTEEYRDRLNKYLNDYSLSLARDELYEILERQFSIPREECEIRIDTQMTDSGVRASYVQILLSGDSIFRNPYDIEEHIGGLLSCKCEALIRSG